MPDLAEQPVWMRKIATLFWAAVLLVVCVFCFNALSTVLLGVLAAGIVSSALSPLLARIPGPRGLGAGLIGLAMIAIVAGILLALSLPLAAPLEQQFSDLGEFKARGDELLTRISQWAHLGKPMNTDELLSGVARFFATDSGSLLLAGVRDAVLAIPLWLAFVFVGSIFMLASPRDILIWPLIRAIPPRRRPDFLAWLDALGSRLRWWMIGTFGGMCVVFTASAIGYSICRLKFALPLALLAGIGEMVSTIGPATAALIAIIFAASQSSSAVIGVILTYACIQILETYLVLPLIMRGAVKIHPAVTLFSIVFWAKVFGVPGLMLAIPINLTIGSAVEYLYVRPREQREEVGAAR